VVVVVVAEGQAGHVVGERVVAKENGDDSAY
jgi:hypothetical protein